MGVNTNHSLVKIYHSTVQCNLQGDPTHIISCPTNVQGKFSMVGIDIKMLDHFGIIDKEVGLPNSQRAAQPIPLELRKYIIRGTYPRIWDEMQIALST